MIYPLSIGTISSLPFYIFRVASRPPIIHMFFLVVHEHMIGIHNMSFSALINRVENLKTVGIGKLIVAVHDNHYRLSGTVIVNSSMMIGQGSCSYAVADQSYIHLRRVLV